MVETIGKCIIHRRLWKWGQAKPNVTTWYVTVSDRYTLSNNMFLVHSGLISCCWDKHWKGSRGCHSKVVTISLLYVTTGRSTARFSIDKCQTRMMSLNIKSISYSWTTPSFEYAAIYSVSNTKNPCAQHFFVCAVWYPMGNFFPFGAAIYSICAWKFCDCALLRKLSANEFFKRANKISESARPHKRIFDARKWALCGQFTRCQHAFTRQKLPA